MLSTGEYIYHLFGDHRIILHDNVNRTHFSSLCDMFQYVPFEGVYVRAIGIAKNILV